MIMNVDPLPLTILTCTPFLLGAAIGFMAGYEYQAPRIKHLSKILFSRGTVPHNPTTKEVCHHTVIDWIGDR